MEKYKDYFTPVAILTAGAMVSLSILAAGGFSVFEQGLFAKTSDNVQKSEGQTIPFGPELYRVIAQEMEVNMEQYEQCVASRKYQGKVEADYQEGLRLGVRGTPGTFVNSRLVSGALPDQLRAAIDAELLGEDSGNADIQISITDQDHIRGNPGAPVTLVEFSDFQCPFCQRFHPSLQQAVNTYGDQVRWVYKHFPLDSHPEARPSAEAAECVAEQKGNEGFWTFADTLFKNQQGLTIN